MKEEKKIMSIIQEDGSIDEVEVLVTFEFTDTKKAYVIYTKNEIDERGNITVYAASILGNVNGQAKLGGIDTDEEWNRIKEVLKSLAKEGQQ
ncbi:MAG: DUF1292 domain-containing protein [bacterium]|nr:DUF1292 domain-containing protein [bacterium]